MKQDRLYVGDTLETAYVAEDYPCGFTARCRKAYWVDTVKGKGQRVVTCTTNPKTGLWNAPKKSTYVAAVVLYLDDRGYVCSEGVTNYSSVEQLEAFAAKFSLDAVQEREIDYVLKAKAVLAEYFKRNPVTFTLTAGGIRNG